MPVRYKLDDDGSNDESTEGHQLSNRIDEDSDDAEGRGRRLP
jgi:hypothetical protein